MLFLEIEAGLSRASRRAACLDVAKFLSNYNLHNVYALVSNVFLCNFVDLSLWAPKRELGIRVFVSLDRRCVPGALHSCAGTAAGTAPHINQRTHLRNQW